MRDGQDAEEEDNGMNMHRMEEDDETDMNARGGALVEEAKRLMADGDDDQAAPAENEAGPKIKMGRLGKRQKKGGAAPADEKKKNIYDKTSEQKGADVFKNLHEEKGKLGGFTEKDITFMKTSI